MARIAPNGLGFAPTFVNTKVRLASSRVQIRQHQHTLINPGLAIIILKM